MLNIDELFGKRPFIYFISGEFYAFGTGVCARCNLNGTYVTLPTRYTTYIEAKRIKISDADAWNAYRRLVSVAEAVKNDVEHTQLTAKFEKMGFTVEEKEEINIQLRDMVKFFKEHNLVEYYK